MTTIRYNSLTTMMGVVVTPNRQDRMNQSRVCVNKTDGGVMAGEVINPFMPKALPFADIAEMLSSLELVMDTLGFPQKYHQHRTFRPAMPQEREEREGGAIRYMDEKSFEKTSGKKSTFIVQVQFRQNATWQGTITWTEKKKEQRFRSTLEMIKLMSDAVEEAEIDQAPMADWEEK